MLASLDVCMGGRVAEELVFGADEVTSGASSDIQKATQIAEQMVTRFGMDASGQVGIVHLPRDGKQSDETLKAIDDEIRRLLNESYSRAKRVLTSHRTELERLAAALLKHETLSGTTYGEFFAANNLISNLI